MTALQERGVHPPVLVRFPQLIDRQLETLQRAFKTAIETFNYRGAYTSVYPMKVNSRRATVARICEAGRRYGVGLEVGTKAELCIALSMLGESGGPIICNGYKDTDYIELAAAASEAGYNVVVVFERPREYEIIGELRAKGLPCPRPRRAGEAQRQRHGPLGGVVRRPVEVRSHRFGPAGRHPAAEGLQAAGPAPAAALPSGLPDHQYPELQAGAAGSAPFLRRAQGVGGAAGHPWTWAADSASTTTAATARRTPA